jgi:hypothetical protein
MLNNIFHLASCPRPARAFFAIVFALRRLARIFSWSAPVILQFKRVPSWAAGSHLLRGEKTPPLRQHRGANGEVNFGRAHEAWPRAEVPVVRSAKKVAIVFPGHMTRGGDVVELGSSLTNKRV